MKRFELTEMYLFVLFMANQLGISSYNTEIYTHANLMLKGQ